MPPHGEGSPMKLPNLDMASVSEQKMPAYLLNPKHPDGAGKASFFIALGFRVEQWEVLAEALKRLTAYNEVSRSVQSEHGWKYVVEGGIETPVGRSVVIRTVWIVDHGQSSPRLVTAYPLGRRNTMIKEHDRIVLTESVPAEGLEPATWGRSSMSMPTAWRTSGVRRPRRPHTSGRDAGGSPGPSRVPPRHDSCPRFRRPEADGEDGSDKVSVG